MKVAQLSCVLPPYGGGIGRVAAVYASILSSEHQVTVFTPYYGDNQRPADIKDVNIKQVRAVVRSGKAAFLPQINRQLSNFEVVHLHYPFFGVQEILSLKPQQKLIVSYHMIAQGVGLKGWWIKKDSAWSEKKLLNRAQLWLVSSQDYANQVVIPRLGRSAPIGILPFGVTNDFSPGLANEDLKKSLGIKVGEKVILFVAGLDKQHYFKGLAVLLSSLQLLNNNCRLIIVGDGNLRLAYEADVKKMGLSSQVIFAGKIAAADLPDYYRLADVFVLPSINNAEAFGLVTLEAMACGVPVIVTNLPGPRSLVKDGETGLVASVNDRKSLAEKINILLNDESLRKKMGVEASKVVTENYRWSKIGEQLLKLYQRL